MLLTTDEKKILDAYRTLSEIEKAFALGLAEHEHLLPHILQQSSEFTSRLARLLAANSSDETFLIGR